MGMGIKDLLALPNHWLDGQGGKAHEKGPGRVSDPNGGRRPGRPPMMLFLPLLNGDVPYPIILKITASPCRKKMSAWQLQYSTRLGHLEYSKTLRVRLNGLIRTDCLLLFLPLETVNSALCNAAAQHDVLCCIGVRPVRSETSFSSPCLPRLAFVFCLGLCFHLGQHHVLAKFNNQQRFPKITLLVPAHA